MNRYQTDYVEILKNKGAFWTHDGNVKRPHPILKGNDHSDAFWQTQFVVDPDFINDMMNDLLQLVTENGLEINYVSRVVAATKGAITFSHDLARLITNRRVRARIPPCLLAYADGELSKMVFKGTTVRPGESMLICGDVITTGGSVARAIQAVIEAGGVVLPFVAMLVNRSGLSEVDGRKIVALIDQPAQKWTAEDCPLCQAGSKAIRPDEKGNWALLNAEC